MKSGCPGQVEFSAVLGIQVTFRSHLPEGKLLKGLRQTKFAWGRGNLKAVRLKMASCIIQVFY